METTFTSAKIAQFSRFCSTARTIAVLSHANPDGDAIGSGVALTLFLRGQGHEVRFFVPNRAPQFLRCVPLFDSIDVFAGADAQAKRYLAGADLFIFVDFNQPDRLEKMADTVAENIAAPRILIDHHLEAPEYELSFSDSAYSSTAHLIYDLLAALGKADAITADIATALYVGMATDTGNFSFGNLTPALYRAVATLVERGAQPVEVARTVFNTQSEDRLRMMGYLISEKLVIEPALHTAYLTLSQGEKTRFNHQVGDTEGMVNLPLSIEEVRFSAFFIETLDCIKVSFRSKGDFDVNRFARDHFNGGGHKNASGGRFFGSMKQAVARFEALIRTEHP